MYIAIVLLCVFGLTFVGHRGTTGARATNGPEIIEFISP